MVENAYLERATGRRGGRPTPPIAHSLQSPSYYELIGQGWGQCHTKRQEPDVGNGKCHSVSAKAATRLSIYSRQAYAPTPTKSAVCKKVRAWWVRFRNPSFSHDQRTSSITTPLSSCQVAWVQPAGFRHGQVFRVCKCASLFEFSRWTPANHRSFF